MFSIRRSIGSLTALRAGYAQIQGDCKAAMTDLIKTFDSMMGKA